MILRHECVSSRKMTRVLSVQTQAVLRQAYSEKVQPVLVLNKIDRLITELNLTPNEAYQQLRRVLEEVNAIAGRLWKEHYVKSIIEQSEAEDWALEEEDDADVYFSPERGNIVFASATEGWGFRLHHFADLYHKKLGMLCISSVRNFI